MSHPASHHHLRREVKPTEVFAAVAPALRPEGSYLLVDIAASCHHPGNRGHPLGPYLYATSCHHCMTISLAWGGAGLGTMWGEQPARHMLTKARFTEVTVRRMRGDIVNNDYIAFK